MVEKEKGDIVKCKIIMIFLKIYTIIKSTHMCLKCDLMIYIVYYLWFHTCNISYFKLVKHKHGIENTLDTPSRESFIFCAFQRKFPLFSLQSIHRACIFLLCVCLNPEKRAVSFIRQTVSIVYHCKQVL